MIISTIYFKWPLSLYYNDMIQLFSSLIVPVPSDVQQLCNVSQDNIGYVNWGYAQIDALILTGGQKYNI